MGFIFSKMLRNMSLSSTSNIGTSKTHQSLSNRVLTIPTLLNTIYVSHPLLGWGGYLYSCNIARRTRLYDNRHGRVILLASSVAMFLQNQFDMVASIDLRLLLVNYCSGGFLNCWRCRHCFVFAKDKCKLRVYLWSQRYAYFILWCSDAGGMDEIDHPCLLLNRTTRPQIITTLKTLNGWIKSQTSIVHSWFSGASRTWTYKSQCNISKSSDILDFEVGNGFTLSDDCSKGLDWNHSNIIWTLEPSVVIHGFLYVSSHFKPYITFHAASQQNSFPNKKCGILSYEMSAWWIDDSGLQIFRMILRTQVLLAHRLARILLPSFVSSLKLYVNTTGMMQKSTAYEKSRLNIKYNSISPLRPYIPIHSL